MYVPIVLVINSPVTVPRQFCRLPCPASGDLELVSVYSVALAITDAPSPSENNMIFIIHEMLIKTRQGNTTQQKDKATQHNSPKAVTAAWVGHVILYKGDFYNILL